VDARLKDGSRVNAVIEPLAIDGPALTIRKFKKGGVNPEKYIEYGSMNANMVQFLRICVENGLNIVISGGTGSGKTTLLTLICGLRSAQEGSLNLLDQQLLGASQNQLIQVRRQIGYIFQAHNLLKSLTAHQNVQMSLQLHPQITPSERNKKATQMLEAVGLGDRIHYYPTDLSGGQKQRVAIARALVSHPRVVLADEPTAALDSKSGRDVVNLMQKLAKEQGCTILMVTHDNRILDVADRIIEMEDGLLVNNVQAR
jgi:putative ABC transport system ATP-binding protein